MKDIRLSLGFWDHWKTATLEAELGFGAVKSLQILWCFAAQNKPSGVLSGMPKRAIAIASKFDGEKDAFVDLLVELRFLDFDGSEYSLHDWEEHNGFVASSEKRSEAAREAVKVRWAKEKNTAVSNTHTDSNTERIRNDTDSNTERIRNDTDSNTERSSKRNTPSPIPSPLPLPLPILKDSCPAVPESALTELVPNSEIVMSIPLNAKDKFFHVTEHDIDQWQETFPGVDVLAELRVCRQWNIDNPKNRKSWNGIRTHISSWLGRSQDKYSSRASPQRPRAMTVRDALTLQSDEIARVLNDDHRNKQQRVDIEHGQKSGLLVEH